MEILDYDWNVCETYNLTVERQGSLQSLLLLIVFQVVNTYICLITTQTGEQG